MIAVKSMNVRDHFKEWCNKVINGETIIVSRPKNENIVMMSEAEYNDMKKLREMQIIWLCWTNLCPKRNLVELL